jgi:hypothetical protein
LKEGVCTFFFQFKTVHLVFGNAHVIFRNKTGIFYLKSQLFGKNPNIGPLQNYPFGLRRVENMNFKTFKNFACLPPRRCWPRPCGATSWTRR